MESADVTASAFGYPILFRAVAMPLTDSLTKLDQPFPDLSSRLPSSALLPTALGPPFDATR